MFVPVTSGRLAESNRERIGIPDGINHGMHGNHTEGRFEQIIWVALVKECLCPQPVDGFPKATAKEAKGAKFRTGNPTEIDFDHSPSVPCHLHPDPYFQRYPLWRPTMAANEIPVWGDSLHSLTSYGKEVKIPDGYVEVLPGDAYKTKLLKAKAETMYIHLVKYKRKFWRTAAMYVPQSVLDEVEPLAAAAAEKRVANADKLALKRQQAQARDLRKASEEFDRQFPHAPPEDREAVLQAFMVSSGRVGRTGTLSLEDKVRLATIAHIRHMHTNYDNMLGGKRDREKRARIREKIWPKIEQKLFDWSGTTDSGPDLYGELED